MSSWNVKYPVRIDSTPGGSTVVWEVVHSNRRCGKPEVSCCPWSEFRDDTHVTRNARLSTTLTHSIVEIRNVWKGVNLGNTVVFLPSTLLVQLYLPILLIHPEVQLLTWTISPAAGRTYQPFETTSCQPSYRGPTLRWLDYSYLHNAVPASPERIQPPDVRCYA